MSDNRKNPGVFFSVDRSLRRSLADQVADGLRRSICTGHYPEGSVVPGLEELSCALGVGMNTVRAAVSRLCEEGLLCSRPHRGSVVQPLGRRGARGRVLIVIPTSRDGYFINVLTNTLRQRLARHRFMAVEIVVMRSEAGVYDFSQLRLELKSAPDLVILTSGNVAVRREVASSGVPFLLYGHSRVRSCSCAGFVREDLEGGVEGLVAQCLRTGVRSVLSWRVWPEAGTLEGALEKAGIAVERKQFDLRKFRGKVEPVQRAGMELFSAFLRSRRSRLPDLVVFPDDDFFAAGALMAILAAGIEVPGEMRIVTLANAGLGPVFPKTLARFEIDPEACGERIARYAYDCLVGRPVPAQAVCSSVYIPGETFPDTVNHSKKERQ
jgi:DNA-binding LacI/PurR family transcriptional regulator